MVGDEKQLGSYGTERTNGVALCNYNTEVSKPYLYHLEPLNLDSQSTDDQPQIFLSTFDPLFFLLTFDQP